MEASSFLNLVNGLELRNFSQYEEQTGGYIYFKGLYLYFGNERGCAAVCSAGMRIERRGPQGNDLYKQPLRPMDP